MHGRPGQIERQIESILTKYFMGLISAHVVDMLHDLAKLFIGVRA